MTRCTWDCTHLRMAGAVVEIGGALHDLCRMAYCANAEHPGRRETPPCAEKQGVLVRYGEACGAGVEPFVQLALDIEDASEEEE